MAVQFASNTDQRLTLLVEPLKPDAGADGHGVYGWRKVVKTTRNRRVYAVSSDWDRRPSEDAHGALIQHMIVWYVICGVTRGELSRRFGHSERQIQSYIGGQAWKQYSGAILEELGRMGISRGRGHHTSRPHEIAAAATATLQAAVDLIGRQDAPEDAVETIRRRAAILAVRWE